MPAVSRVVMLLSVVTLVVAVESELPYSEKSMPLPPLPMKLAAACETLRMFWLRCSATSPTAVSPSTTLLLPSTTSAVVVTLVVAVASESEPNAIAFELPSA